MGTALQETVHSELLELGERIRDLRARHDWTFEELAKRAGLSKSYLSRLEEGERQPSIAALLSLAQAFGLPLSAMFPASVSGERCTVVRAGEALPREGNGLFFSPLSRSAFPARMQPIRVTIPVSRTGEELYRHEGEEWLFVLSGRLRLILGAETFDLGPEDSAHFDASLPHRLTARGPQEVELILVACAAPKLLQSYF